MRIRSHRICRYRRFLSLIIYSVILVSVTFPPADGQDKPADPKPAAKNEEQYTFQKYQDMVLPEAETLLRSRPFDWIVLKSQDTIVAEPVKLRPDTLARLAIKYDMAQRTYSRILKHKPYKEAEIASLRTYNKAPEKAEEINARETAVKAELDTARDRMEALKPATYKMIIVLPDATVDSDFTLELRLVDFIVHYEDLLLRRADQLIQAGNVPLAYDLLLVVARRYREVSDLIRMELETEEKDLVAAIKRLEDERTSLRQAREDLNSPRNKTSAAAKMRLTGVEKTIVAIPAELKDLDEDLHNIRYKLRFARPREYPNPDPPRKDELLLPCWPKFDEVYLRFMLKDSDQHLERGDLEGAWRLLMEVWKPGIENADMSSRMGTIIGRLIAPHVDHQDFRQARFYLRELQARDPSSSVATVWKDKLIELATTAVAAAQELSSRGDFAAAVRKIDVAARVWPELAGLKETHRELTDRYQILKVGVVHLPGEQSPDRLPTEADDRVRMLSEARMFEPVNVTDQTVRYASAFFESWEPTDLGRQVHFQLKLRRSDWEARPLITSADLYRELTSRLQPDSPAFDERLAAFVEGIAVQSPTEFTVRFQQLPLRLESLWQVTVAAEEMTRLLNEFSRDANVPIFGRERFHRLPVENGQLRLTRVREQPATTRQRRVDEVVEIRYDTWERALQALLRGDVIAIPSVDLSDLKGLQDDGRFVVVPYMLPRSHLLMFNPRSTALNDSQLRRALLYGVPREKLLNGIILKDARAANARLITCPFASNSYAYNRALPQPDYEPALAATLAFTAKKQMGGQIPPLTMICPDDPRARQASQAMIENWRRIGVEVQLATDPASSPDWDVSYRMVKSIEPLMDAWPILTMSADARIASLQGVPDSTRRILLELERSVDWTAATKLLNRLSMDLLIDARYVPLWEVDEFLVARRNVTGLPARLVHAYQDIERWSVQSWYPQDLQ